MTEQTPWRQTTQDLPPVTQSASTFGQYSLYPAFSLGEERIESALGLAL